MLLSTMCTYTLIVNTIRRYSNSRSSTRRGKGEIEESIEEVGRDSISRRRGSPRESTKCKYLRIPRRPKGYKKLDRLTHERNNT